ncbi:hypothetical protein L1987_80289 [Smallanthus sonchifolius]|uniref:Uncharacterized protein n=1 Tax=Smallanthus sonchifolius TaxID=185202 RepID=A0ACB8YLI0_9ASTR|nr:hypothetical protein L1987_80289 [Smallanthus sonchifolius]
MEAVNFVLQVRSIWAKFGGYGSFLPTYQRSPAGPHSKTSPKVHVNNTSPNDLHLQLDLHIPFMMFQSKKTSRNGLD